MSSAEHDSNLSFNMKFENWVGNQKQVKEEGPPINKCNITDEINSHLIKGLEFLFWAWKDS